MHYLKDLGATASSSYILAICGGLCDTRLFASRPINKKKDPRKWYLPEVFFRSISQLTKSTLEKLTRSSEEEIEYQIPNSSVYF
jgi:hypothetical protein